MKQEKNLMQDTRLAELVGTLPNVKNQVDRLVIDSPTTQRRATELLKTIKEMKREIEDRRKDFLKSFQLVIKNTNAKAKDITRPLIEMDEKLRGGLVKYHEFLEAKQREAEKKRQQEEAAKQAELDKLNKKADNAKSFDKIVETEQKIEEVKNRELAPDIEVRNTVRGEAGTTSFRKIWQHEITDPNKIPREYMIPDPRTIQLAILKKGIREIPGVRIYEKTITSIR